MSIERFGLNPLEARERQVIAEGTEVLGGVLLTRAGIVVDLEENPAPYQAVLHDIDDRLTCKKRPSTYDTLKTVDAVVRRHVSYDHLAYLYTLKIAAEERGVDHLDQASRLGLSAFIGEGGICQQHALLEATMIRLLQQRGDLGGTVSLESTRPNPTHPDRHIRVAFFDATDSFTLDIADGVKLAPPRFAAATP